LPQNIKTEDEKENNVNLDSDNQAQLQNQQIETKENKIRYVRKSPLKDNRISLTARLNENDLVIFNQRLKLFGFNSLNEMVREFTKGNFPVVTEDKQIDNLYQNQQAGGMKSLLEGGNNSDFYERADTKDMYNYFLNVRKFHPNTCRDIISYFKRFRDIFFTEKIDEIRSLTPRVKSKIMDALRKFGQYYLYKYNNEQVIDLVEKIIRRHSLFVGNTDHGKLYIVDDNYLESKLKLIFDMNGEIGLIVKFGLFSGLREDELIYIHNKPLCSNLSGCTCEKLHVMEKPNGISIILIQWHRGHKKCYFTVVPTSLFKSFRNLGSFSYKTHIRSAHSYIKTKDESLNFMWLRKAHYNVMCRTMKPFEANILAGRAKTVDAKHYAIYELDSMTNKYVEAWSKYGIKFNS
jgi:intergrase/recombinase